MSRSYLNHLVLIALPLDVTLCVHASLVEKQLTYFSSKTLEVFLTQNAVSYNHVIQHESPLQCCVLLHRIATELGLNPSRGNKFDYSTQRAARLWGTTSFLHDRCRVTFAGREAIRMRSWPFGFTWYRAKKSWRYMFIFPCFCVARCFIKVEKTLFLLYL